VDGELYDLTPDPFELENRFRDPARQSEISRMDLVMYYLGTCKRSTCVFVENASFLN
jgi:hypothetical protein